MHDGGAGISTGLTEGLLRLRLALVTELVLQPVGMPGRALPSRGDAPWLLAEATDVRGRTGAASGEHRGEPTDDLAVSSADDAATRQRLIALVDLARGGDKDAFGQLYDHYHQSVFRFLYYRVGSVPLAEDLTGETFFRALRNMTSFTWQGKDFGAWLMTIARNLATDHFKSSRHRLERPTEQDHVLDRPTEGPESDVLASLTNERLLDALRSLPNEQRDCIVLRFLQGLSLAETAEALERSTGAIKQLQLRGVRNLAKLLPAELLG